MYPIIQVPSDAADLPEQLGSKPKFWFQENRYLFKEVRPGTGEDWSEKVASELCSLLGIPHADYELGLWNERRGVVSETFLPVGGRLIHGNEILAKVIPEYPLRKRYRVRQHTLRRVLGFVNSRAVNLPLGIQPFTGVDTAADVFVGYVMLDAWIGNQDRHHENWGLVLTQDRKIHLAPSYDHASSLGRIETDEEKRERLTTKDRNRTVEYYVERAGSAFYASPLSEKPLSTLDAFKSAARFFPLAALAWLKRLGDVSMDNTEHIFSDIPTDRISEVSISFAQQMLSLNRARLLNCLNRLLA